MEISMVGDKRGDLSDVWERENDRGGAGRVLFDANERSE
jgi:hypothetical protein